MITRWHIAFLALVGVAHIGCQSRMQMCAVIKTNREPLVTLVDTTETNDSPARACVISPYPTPVFPRDLYLAQIEGSVVVRVTIGKDGRVKDAVAIRSSQREFEEPSVAAVKRWKFLEMRDPGVKENFGAVVDCTIKFSFEEEPNKAPEPTSHSVTPRAIVPLPK